jgi:acetoin utilization deacetylase AcuC-like enzyme
VHLFARRDENSDVTARHEPWQSLSVVLRIGAMKIVYTPTHAAHGVKSEFDGVRPIPAYEVPIRAENVRAEIDRRKMGAFATPRDFGLGPIARVHDAAFVGFLKSAFAKFQDKHGRDVIEAFPSSWPARRLRQIPGQDIDGVMGYYCFDTATPILDGTWTAALDAANCALTAAEHVADTGGPAFALCRPPGHHAAHDMYGGYCFFNNAAVAAQWLTDQGRRVAILDVDYHHGNGTQDIFYRRADVLTVSIHADPTWAYPHFLGYADETGEGAGEGANVNLPLPYGTAWDAYAGALSAALGKVDAFGPDAVIVALGLDTYAEDPIAKFRLYKDDYLKLGAALARLKRPVLFTMEGGYNLDALGTITANALEGFLNA